MKLQDFLAEHFPEIDLSTIAKNTALTADEDNLIDSIDINAVISHGKYAGQSIAYCLASDGAGRRCYQMMMR